MKGITWLEDAGSADSYSSKTTPMTIRPQDIGLLQNRPFRRLVESRAVGQIAQNALLYSLLILVVNKTESSIQSTVLVVAFILPSIVLGIPAGAPSTRRTSDHRPASIVFSG